MYFVPFVLLMYHDVPEPLLPLEADAPGANESVEKIVFQMLESSILLIVIAFPLASSFNATLNSTLAYPSSEVTT